MILLQNIDCLGSVNGDFTLSFLCCIALFRGNTEIGCQKEVFLMSGLELGAEILRSECKFSSGRQENELHFLQKLFAGYAAECW
jgi:hypothetical protein